MATFNPSPPPDPLRTLMMIRQLRAREDAIAEQRAQQALDLGVNLAMSDLPLKDALPILRSQGLRPEAEPFILGVEKQRNRQRKIAEAEGMLPTLVQAGTPGLDEQGRPSFAPGQAQGFASGLTELQATVPPEERARLLNMLAAGIAAGQAQQNIQLASERRAERQDVRAVGRREGAQVRAERRAEARRVQQLDEETVASTLAFGSPEQQRDAADFLRTRYGERADAMRERLYLRGQALSLEAQRKLEQSPGAAENVIKLQFFEEQGFNRGDAIALSLGLGVPDPAAPDGSQTRVLVGFTREAAAKRSAINELDANLRRIEQTLDAIAADPAARQQVAGLAGADPFQSVRRLTASQNRKVAMLGTLLNRGIRAAARMSDTGNLSDFDVRFARDMFPLTTEAIDPQTGQVSEAARGRLAGVRAVLEDARWSPYNPAARERVESGIAEALSTMSEAELRAVRGMVGRARPQERPFRETQERRGDAEAAATYWQQYVSPGFAPSEAQ